VTLSDARVKFNRKRCTDSRVAIARDGLTVEWSGNKAVGSDIMGGDVRCEKML